MQPVHIGGDLWGPHISLNTDRHPETPTKTAIFDRDGPLNSIYDVYQDDVLQEERGPQTFNEFYAAVHGNHDQYDEPNGFHVEQFFTQLADDDYQIAVLTNQPDVYKADRSLNYAALQEMNTYLLDIGADIVVACPHPAPNWEAAYAETDIPRWPIDEDDWRCHCHKPQPGMFHFLDEFLTIDYSKSFLVGDSASDLDAIRRHTQENIGELFFIQEYPRTVKQPPRYADAVFEDIVQLAATLYPEHNATTS